MEDVDRSECSSDDAAKLLEYAAEYLENGEVVPKPLADFLAQAFRRTVAVTQDKRSSELAAWLNLTALNRRPKIPENEIGLWVFRQLFDDPKKSEGAALKEAVKQYGISRTTATDHWRAWAKKNPKFVETLARVGASKLKI